MDATTREIRGDGWDAAVIGAGPAGSTTAFHLARRGWRVLLLDRRVFPRDKVCGDGLIPDALRALGRMGLAEEVRAEGRSLEETSVFSPSRIEVRLPGEFVTLERRRLDAMMLRRAVDGGAEFRRAEVEGVEGEPGKPVRLRLRGIPGAVRARAAVVATGASLRIADRLRGVRSAGPSAVAVRGYVRSRYRLDRLVVSYDRSILPGYAWIFPLGDGVYNVGCGVFYRSGTRAGAPLGDLFRRFRQEFPPARALFRDARETTGFRGAPLRCGLAGAPPVGPGSVVCVGEAVGATFPFTGEGIGKAMETGEIAAEVLHEAMTEDDPGRLARYGQRLRAELDDKYLAYRVAEGWLSRSWVADWIARRAAASSTLRATLAGILAETVEPTAVFSLRGVLRSVAGAFR